MRLKVACIFVGCLAVATALVAGGVKLPSGTELASGVIDDDGRVYFVARGEDVGDGSYVVRRSGARQEVFELPNTWVKHLRLLEDGRLLLFSSKGPSVKGRRSLALEIIEVRANEVVTLWSWGSQAACQRECEPPVVSSDGKSWGVFSSDQGEPSKGTFTFGGTTKTGKRSVRTEVVDFGAPNRNDFPESGFFWFLDADSEVVMVPWSGGAYIVHLDAGGSPYAVPVLQGPDRVGLRWQGGDRILWVDSGSRWKAYHLWDLGLSGMPSEALWEHEKKEGWIPHPERGVVRLIRDRGSYRFEHLWREPWSSLGEYHVSDWRSGTLPRSGLGRDWLVSANGQHGAVLETRWKEETTVELDAASFEMRWEPLSLPPAEAVEPAARDSEPLQHGAPAGP